MHKGLDSFKYIKNISDGIGEIRIYEQIGTSYKNGKEFGISGPAFANEMAYLKTVCNKINIRVNSEGGSVLDGYAIFSSILNAGVETESFIDGVAASTAGWCAMAANKCNIADYGTLMVHGAHGAEDEIISLANRSIAKMLSNRTGMTEDEANALMKKETWYKAFDKKDRDTLINKKLVDAITETGKKLTLPKNTKGLAEVYNKLINPEEMAEQNKEVETLNKQLADKEAELKETQNRLKVIEAKIAEDEKKAKDALKVKAVELGNQAKAKGLSEVEVTSLVENASKDEASFSFASNMVSKLGNSKESKKPFDFKNVKDSTGKEEDRSSWSYWDWEKKDAAALTNMFENDRAAYDELFNKSKKK